MPRPNDVRDRAIKRMLVRILKSVPCADCATEYDPRVMDFDHRGNKVGIISRMVVSHGFDTLLREVAKCDVVCANCHRARTFRSLV